MVPDASHTLAYTGASTEVQARPRHHPAPPDGSSQHTGSGEEKKQSLRPLEIDVTECTKIYKH